MATGALGQGVMSVSDHFVGLVHKGFTGINLIHSMYNLLKAPPPNAYRSVTKGEGALLKLLLESTLHSLFIC